MSYDLSMPLSPENCPAGTVLQVPYRVMDIVPYKHMGITDGDGHVISNSKKKRKVICQPLPAFADGKRVTINSAFQGGGASAYKRASKRINEPYDVLNNNCEHFVNSVYGKEKKSQQLQNAVVAGGVCFVLFMLLKRT